MNIKMFSTLKMLLLALCCAASLHAQVTSSSVSGTVLDAHGAVVPGAKVTLRNDAQSSSSRTLVASPLGTFTFTPVVTSTYTLVVEAPGFKKYEDRGIVVDPDARVDLSNITLEVGAVSETVQVEANAVQLQTQTAQRDTVVTSRMAVDLPIVDRSFMSLLQVVPGIVGASRYGGNINGNRNDSMSVKLDGMSNMDSGVNMCCSTWVNMDTIAEFKVITNNQSADIGHSGGASISVVSKSGTKQFHGSAYGFLRNESLNANTWMNNYNSVARPIYRYNTEGFTLGGPVWVPSKLAFLKNKLFFFASEEKQNSLTGTALHTNSVPTAAERGGDFSNARDGSNNLITIKDPLAGGAAFPGNLIPVNRFSHDGLALLNVMPMPNSSVNATYNYVSQNPYHQPELIGTYKFDYNISDRWRSYVRYTRDFYNSENPSTAMKSKLRLRPGAWTTSFIASSTKRNAPRATPRTNSEGREGSWFPRAPRRGRRAGADSEETRREDATLASAEHHSGRRDRPIVEL